MNPFTKMPNQRQECESRFGLLKRQGMRSAFLFINFFLIIMALYQLKPASRSFFLDTSGADMLPYVWIGTAVTMIIIIRWYNRLVERYSRLNVVIGSCLTFIALLTLFRAILVDPAPAEAAAFYIFVDILGVVLVEQFWCLTNSIFTTDDGKTWYGFIGTGGLIGGVVSGAFGALLIKETALATADLLLVADVILTIILGLTWIMGASGVYCEAENPAAKAHVRGDLGALIKNHYLLLIAGMLFLGQVASQFVEFQFMKSVEGTYADRDSRTAYLSMFFSVLSFIAIGINLVFTPLVHRLKGALAGLMVQPLLMSLSSIAFLTQPTLMVSAAMKVSDRGMSYSINRASRELLYVPVNPVVIYQAKAWIDMFGYRTFKAVGSVIILVFTQWLPFAVNARHLSLFTIFTCVAWIVMILMIRKEYHSLLAPAPEA